MYAIVFDLDTALLGQLYHGNSPNNAYADIRKYLTSRGFEWKQESTYLGDQTVDAVRLRPHRPAPRSQVRLVHALRERRTHAAD